jgi:hypothetical protein
MALTLVDDHVHEGHHLEELHREAFEVARPLDVAAEDLQTQATREGRRIHVGNEKPVYRPKRERLE